MYVCQPDVCTKIVFVVPTKIETVMNNSVYWKNDWKAVLLLEMQKWAQFVSCYQTFQSFGILFLSEDFYFFVFNFSLQISLNFGKMSKSQMVDLF